MSERGLSSRLTDRWSSASTVRTDDVDAARDHLQGVLARHKLTPRRPRTHLDFIHQHTCPGQLSLGTLTYGADVQVSLEIPDFYFLQITLNGVCQISSRYWDVTLKPGSLFVMNPNIPYIKRWNGNAQQLQVKIPASLLRRYLQMESDDAVSRQLEFSAVILSERDAGGSLIDLVDYLCRDVLDPKGLWRSGHVLDQMEGAVLSAILHSFPHDQLLRLHRKHSPAAPRYVRRAEEYIRSHLCEPIGMVDVSTAAGVSSRTLQDGFRRFHDTTPAIYIRDLRLKLAQQQLQAAKDTGQTVTQIALSCGFGHVGRFARMFAIQFGETPSSALRRYGKFEAIDSDSQP